MSADDDRRTVFLDHPFPPPKRVAAHDTAGIPAERAAPDFLCRFVNVTHHQEEKISGPKGVVFPGPVDWKGPLRCVDAREFSVFAGRINPFAPPPGLRFIETTAVMITPQVVDFLAMVLL